MGIKKEIDKTVKEYVKEKGLSVTDQKLHDTVNGVVHWYHVTVENAISDSLSTSSKKTTKTKFELNGYTYENLVYDCCHSANQRECSLATSIHDNLYGFKLMYGTDESYVEVLGAFNKSYEDFIKDVYKKYRELKRNERMNFNL